MRYFAYTEVNLVSHMMYPFQLSGIRFSLLLILSATVGALSGAAAASFTVNPYMLRPSIHIVQQVPEPISATSTSSTLPQLVSLETGLVQPLVPPDFVNRGTSPVAAVYRKSRGTSLEERILTDDRLIGQAVALTSDGWFMTTSGVFDGLRIADLTLWHGGKTHDVQQAVIDHVNGTVYVKTNIRELTAPAFGQAITLQPGARVWLERRSGLFVPTYVASLADARTDMDILSSDIAQRRLVLHGQALAGDAGVPVWDDRGALLGIVDAESGESLRVIPSTSISASVTSFLTNAGKIRHAMLGVRGRDVARWRIDGDRGSIPHYGFLLMEDKKAGKLAVAKDSPAAAAGFKNGDVILGIEHDILDGTFDLGELLSEYKPGASVNVRVLRNAAEIAIPVTLGTTTTSESLK